MSKFIKLFVAGTGIFGAGSIYCIKTGNEDYYKHVLMPLVRKLPGEDSHRLAVLGFKLKLFNGTPTADPDNLHLKFLNFDLKNPVGIAAGFDKNAEAVEGLDQIGFGYIEVGSVTPKPQPGNAKPRVFRLVEDRAIINRYGFNSDGMDVVRERLIAIRSSGSFKGVLGVNLGKNKTSENAIEDYKEGIRTLGPHCDYLVINVSSPNTPGLRSLQSKQELKDLLCAALEERNKLQKKVPILLKIAPDLLQSELQDIAQLVCDNNTRVDGMIVSNTTIQRPATLKSASAQEGGGLSGKPLKNISTEVISQMYKLTKGRVPIIGVGGIASGQDAYEKILAGATALQIYTAMINEGPIVVNRIKAELSELLKINNYNSVQDAVGKGHNSK